MNDPPEIRVSLPCALQNFIYVQDFATPQPHLLDVVRGTLRKGLRNLVFVVNVNRSEAELNAFKAPSGCNQHKSRRIIGLISEDSFHVVIPLVEQVPRLNFELSTLVAFREGKEFLWRFLWSTSTYIRAYSLFKGF